MTTGLKQLKNMNYKQLDNLAEAIRWELVDSVSKTGGHLSSNLGIVELTIGLHRVFDSPKDRILWDVGHQAYVHKILTGRESEIHTLRQLDGISGFPKRRESPHDTYDAGHSSTSIGAALGMAAARDLKGENKNIIAVIGDGSLTGGPAFEALNNVENLGTKVIIVLNDNGMSISRNIGGLSEHLGKLRTSSGYITAKRRVRKAVQKVPGVGDKLTEAIINAKDRVKYALLSGGVVFEELGLTYLGPVDGHNIKDVVSILEQAKNARGSVLVHVITQKGKGYGPAEDNPDLFHGIGPFDKETGIPFGGTKETYSDVFGNKLLEMAEEHEEIIGITAAMMDGTGLKECKERFPKRIFDAGIAEAHSIIFAAGAALEGMRPVVVIYSSFLQRAYDELMEDVCLQNLPVIIGIDRAGVVGQDGETHQGIFDLSYLLPMPNMTVLAPADGEELREAMDYAYSLEGPVAIRYPRGKADLSIRKEAFAGKNIRIREGKDVEILALGTILGRAVEAAVILKTKGIDAGIVNVAMVKPFDEKVVNTKSKLIVTVEDNVEAGGFGEMITCLYPDKKVLRIAWPDKFIEQGKTEELFQRYKMDVRGIAERIEKEIEGKA